jgi:predicted MFS family arabinose efflux permease
VGPAFLALGAAGLAGACAVALALPHDGPPSAVLAPGVRALPRSLLAPYAPLARHTRALALVGASSLRAVFWMGVILYLGALFSERHGFGTGEVGLVYLASGVGYLAGSAAAGSQLGAAEPRTTHAATTVAPDCSSGSPLRRPSGPLSPSGAPRSPTSCRPSGG